MIPPQSYTRELRVLVLAPFGRDSELTREVLRDVGIDASGCESIEQLCDELRLGAGAAIVAAEVLQSANVTMLADTLSEQAPWSDIPLVLATAGSRVRTAREWTLPALKSAGHVILLERPILIQTLVSTVRSALNARRRQYQVRDLVEELQLTVQRLADERVVRERFIELLAHDLRGPLSASRISAQMLSTRPQSPEAIQTLAGRIDKSLDRANKMIHDLLDAHRLRAGQRLPVELERCDLMSIVRGVTEDLGNHDRARIVLQGPARLEGYWDADLLWRTIWNLVTNAIKYGSPETPIKITAGRSKNIMWATVHNHGSSIPPDQQQQMFEPFTRARSTAAAGAPSGWGLGLSLARGVAAAHGGKLEVSSDPASGTAFTLRIPLDARPFQS